METYRVAGGWHATDHSKSITCFGATEQEAVAALQRGLERAVRLQEAHAQREAARPVSTGRRG
jgi:hypothetical protein